MDVRITKRLGIDFYKQFKKYQFNMGYEVEEALDVIHNYLSKGMTFYGYEQLNKLTPKIYHEIKGDEKMFNQDAFENDLAFMLSKITPADILEQHKLVIKHKKGDWGAFKGFQGLSFEEFDTKMREYLVKTGYFKNGGVFGFVPKSEQIDISDLPKYKNEINVDSMRATYRATSFKKEEKVNDLLNKNVTNYQLFKKQDKQLTRFQFDKEMECELRRDDLIDLILYAHEIGDAKWRDKLTKKLVNK